MNNAERRELLEQTKRAQQEGFEGSVLDVFQNPQTLQDFYKEHQPLPFEHVRQESVGQNKTPQIEVASTPNSQRQGLRGRSRSEMPQAMVFPNVSPNTPFNTMGMKAPIDIKKYDEQGHLVKSYENVPPGIKSLPTGPARGTIVETPSRMRSGGKKRKYQGGGNNSSRLQLYNDSLQVYNATQEYNQKMRDLQEVGLDLQRNYTNVEDAKNAFDTIDSEALNIFTDFNNRRTKSNKVFSNLDSYTLDPLIFDSPDKTYRILLSYINFPKPTRPDSSKTLKPLKPIRPSQINTSQPTSKLQTPTSYKPIVKGRTARTVYKQDPTVSTGQYPIGEDVWDTEKKQWRRDLWDEEMQRDSRELAIPRVPYAKFKYGGYKPLPKY